MRLILRHRRLLAFALLLGVLLCGAQTLTEPQRYTATARLLVVPDTLNVEAFQENPPATRKKVAALTPPS
jgi:uncharacterized protein involved in exopolysaccharide biosynthesis